MSVTCRAWRSFSYDDFERDLQQSSLVCSRHPTSTSSWRHTTTRSRRSDMTYWAVRRSTRPSQDWFDADCRAAKRTTRSLERVSSPPNCWHTRHLEEPIFHTTASIPSETESVRLLSMTIAECVGDARQLWFKINNVTKPPTVSQFWQTEYNLAIYCQSYDPGSPSPSSH